MVVTKLFFLHLLLGFLSAQWWGLPPGFRPRTRLGAQRGLRIPNQAAGSYYGAPTGRNFFRVSESLLQSFGRQLCQTNLLAWSWIGLLDRQLRVKQLIECENFFIQWHWKVNVIINTHLYIFAINIIFLTTGSSIGRRNFSALFPELSWKLHIMVFLELFSCA